MSGFSPNASHSQPPSSLPSPDLPDLAELAALAEKLQEALSGLLAFCRRSWRDEKPGATPDGRDPREGAGQEKTPCEIRCYTIPGNILDEEQEMLERYKADNWQDLLNKAHDRLYATILLMERIPAEEELDGFSITLIAENLMSPLKMLGRVCSLVADFCPTSMTKTA